MKKIDSTWQIFSVYLIILSLVLFAGIAFGQESPCKENVCVVEFNASWNESNGVDYLNNLTDCGIKRINIDEGDWQKKYKIVIVPTIIVFNGDEVERFQADISFKMLATRKEVQGVVDEIIMSDF